MRRLLALVLAAGCGRIGYDDRRAPDAALDAEVEDLDAAIGSMFDAQVDALAPCPSGTTELSVGSPVCIELTERGTIPWTAAKLDCEALGRRLCADAEWFEGCVNAVGLVDMFDNAWEWVAEESAGVAQKRGPLACTDISSHVVTDPYEYRCCADR